MRVLRQWLPAVLLVTGCASAPVPMRQVSYVKTPDAKCLVVLLPGRGDSAEDFDEHGLIGVLKDAGLSVDVIAADATFGYYMKGVLTERLQRDVLDPARAAHSYQQVWLMGASMGGFGSFFYPSQREGEIDGVFGMAAYLGKQDVIEDIQAQGGLKTWHAPEKAPANDDNYSGQLWRFLQQTTQPGVEKPQLFIGWGLDDGLGRADGVLGAVLPTSHVFTAAGGHKWTTWKVLLEAFLAEGSFKQACGANPG